MSNLFYRVTVAAGGAAYEVSPRLRSLTLTEEHTGPDRLSLALVDRYKVLGHALQEGMDVEVDMGTTDDHAVLFRGRIYQVEAAFPTDDVPTLTVSAHDNTMRMGLRSRNRVWTELSLSDLVQSVAGAYGFAQTSIEVSGDPQFTGNGIRQDNETDLAFLLRLAQQYGCELFIDPATAGDHLKFLAQSTIMQSEPEVTLHYGRSGTRPSLLAFQASADVSALQLPRVLSGIDYETGEPIEVTEAQMDEPGDTEDAFFDENLSAYREVDEADAVRLEALLAAAPAVQQALRDELGGTVRETQDGFTTEEDMQQRAMNRFSTSLLGMSGSGRTTGNKALHANHVLRLSDVGGRFSGVWYASQVTHSLTGAGYATEFQCRR